MDETDVSAPLLSPSSLETDEHPSELQNWVSSAESHFSSARNAANRAASDFRISAEHTLGDVRERGRQIVHSAEEKLDDVRKRAGEIVQNAEDKMDKVKNAAVLGVRRLLHYHELPGEWQDNEFILTGYRFYSSRRACLRSVFAVHNETCNIWTHIIGLLFFIGVGIHTILFALPYLSNQTHAFSLSSSINSTSHIDSGSLLENTNIVHPADSAVHLLFFFAAGLCLGCSATFHTFLCHSRLDIAKGAATLDYMGIAFLISASVSQVVYYGFYTASTLRTLYMTITLIIGITGTLLPLFPWFDTKPYRPLRILLFVLQASAAIFPILHMFFGRGVAVTLQFTEPLLYSILCYLLGVICYSNQLPERFGPGRFDFLGASHQIWHVCVVAGIWCQHRASLHFFEGRWEYGALPIACEWE